MPIANDIAKSDFLNDLEELLRKHNACLDIEYDHERGASLSFDIGTTGCWSTGNMIVDDVLCQRDIDANFVSNLSR